MAKQDHRSRNLKFLPLKQYPISLSLCYPL